MQKSEFFGSVTVLILNLPPGDSEALLSLSGETELLVRPPLSTKGELRPLGKSCNNLGPRVQNFACVKY